MKPSKSATLLMDMRTSDTATGPAVPSPLMGLSNPPTKPELDQFKDVPASDLPGALSAA